MGEILLLREYLQEILVEDGDDGGDYGDYGYGGGGGGSGGGKGLAQLGPIADIFITPFTDVFKTGQAVVADISSKTQTLVGGILGSVIASFLPGLTVDWEELKRQEKERTNKIKEKYKDVFTRTNAALFTGDGAVFMFLSAPHEYLTYKAAEHAPDVVLNLLDAIMGERMDSFIGRLRNRISSFKQALGTSQSRADTSVYGGGSGGGYGGGGYGDYGYGGGDGYAESVSLNKRIISEKKTNELQSILSSKEVKQAIEKSPIINQMKKDFIQNIEYNVQIIVSKAKNDLKVESTEKLDKISKGKFKQGILKVTPEERKKAAKYVAIQLKKAIKKFYIEKLEAEAKKMPKSVQKIYYNGIKEIESL